MRRLDAFWKFPAVAHHPVKYASFRQTALASGFAPVAQNNAEHTYLFALGDDLGFGLRRPLLLVLAIIRLDYVQANRYSRLRRTQGVTSDNHRNQTFSRTAGKCTR